MKKMNSDGVPDRLHSLDTLKGSAILALVFLHCAVYYYGNIDSVDMENPPLLIAVIGVMVMWGGLFAVLSGCVNTYRYVTRHESPPRWNPRRRLFLAGIALLVLHVIYNAVASPTSFDFETGNHKYALIAQLLRNGTFELSLRRMVEGTALLMLGLNLVVLAAFLPFILRRRHPLAIMVGLVVVFLASGLLRFPLHPVYSSLVSSERYLLAFLLSPLVPKPYPVLPYAAFVFAGAAFGFSLAKTGRAPRFSWLAGAALLVLGALGVVFLPTNLVGVDYFWYAKVFLELGVFVLIMWAVLRVAGAGKATYHIVQRVARMSLTVYVLQTPLSELFAAGMTAVWPGWNATIGAAVLFGALNVAVWLGLVAAWSAGGYRVTVERLWMRIFPGSTKLAGLP